MKRMLMVATLALMPAAVHAQAAKADTVKLGKYEIELTMESGTLTGELVVKREKGEYNAFIRAGGMTPAVQSFKRDGANYVLKAGDEAHAITYTFTFVRDSLRGKFDIPGMMTGTVAGVFKP